MFSFGNVPYRCRRFSQMAALSDFHFDEDGWVRSTCLHREGHPVLLWEVLQEFGHTEPPQYYGRVSSEGGISGWEARLRVPARLGLFQSDPWEVHTEGAEILSVWDRAAAMAITQFCEQEPIFASYSASTVGFPVRVTSEYSRQRFSLLLDSTLPGHVPALARIARYAAGMLGVCDQFRNENTLYRQGLRTAHATAQEQTQQILGQSQQLAEQSQQVVWLAQQFLEQEQRIVEQAQQIAEQSQQLEEQSQQLAEQAQQIEELTEQVDDQEALADHLQDALQVALGNVHQLQLQQQQAAAPPEPPPQVSGVESGVGPQEMSDAESSVGQNDVPPQAGSTAILVNEQNVARLQEELRARGIEVERVFEYQPPR